MPVLVDLGGNSQQTAFEGEGQQNELGGDVWVSHLRNRLQTNMRTRFFIKHTCICFSHTHAPTNLSPLLPYTLKVQIFASMLKGILTKEGSSSFHSPLPSALFWAELGEEGEGWNGWKEICRGAVPSLTSWFFKFSSVAQLCPTLCEPMDCSTTGLPVHHQLLELAQTHVHRVSDAIQPSHPLSSRSPPAFNLSQDQGLFKWVSSSIRWPKDWSFSFSISPSNEYSGLFSFRIDWLVLLAVQGTFKSLLQQHSSKASIL